MFICSRRLFAAAFLIVISSSCKKETGNPLPNSSASITAFSFRSSVNGTLIRQDLEATIDDTLISVHIPYLADVGSLIPTFSTDAGEVTLNGVRQVSDSSVTDFRHLLHYSVVAEDGTAHGYAVSVKQYTDLPIVRVTTMSSAPVNSTEEYVDATVNIQANGTALADYEGKTEIRGRGNSTWNMPKKPYRLKLDKKSDILGMPSNKNWVLLANYADKTLMRTKIAFTLGEWFGMSYSPRGQFVELFLNGSYEGCYYLTEQLKPDPNRVAITEMSESDEASETITGGYMLEVDVRLDAEHTWYTNTNVAIALKEPEDITPAQLTYIKTYVQDMENSIYAADFNDPQTGYQKYINDDTFIQWYWVNELFRNQDAAFYSSTFLYKERNEKMSFGPLWDFDIGAGNIDYNNSWEPAGWYIRNSYWFARLFQDPAFRSKAKQKYNEVKPKLAGLMDLIDSTAGVLRYSQVENFTKWDILNTWVWPNYQVQGSYIGEVGYLKTWLKTRMVWIESQLALEQ